MHTEMGGSQEKAEGGEKGQCVCPWGAPGPKGLSDLPQQAGRSQDSKPGVSGPAQLASAAEPPGCLVNLGKAEFPVACGHLGNSTLCLCPAQIHSSAFPQFEHLRDNILLSPGPLGGATLNKKSAEFIERLLFA